jgi:hypothetical protein
MLDVFDLTPGAWAAESRSHLTRECACLIAWVSKFRTRRLTRLVMSFWLLAYPRWIQVGEALTRIAFSQQR